MSQQAEGAVFVDADDASGFVVVEADAVAVTPGEAGPSNSADVVIQSGEADAQVIEGGPPGASAYEVWLLLPGNAGRPVEDFLESLRGPRGLQGAAGTALVLPAAGTLLAFRAVTTNASGEVVYCDAGREDHADQLLGVNENSAAEGSDVTIASMGPISNPGWSWIPDEPVFVGLMGQLTQDSEVGLFCQAVGYARTPTEIIIRPGAAFIRG